MSSRDYILCAECKCKLIYDGEDAARDRLEMIWGDEEADVWTVELLCPDCIKALRIK